MTHSFNVVSVGTRDKGGVVVGMVMRSQALGAVICTSCCESTVVEVVDLFASVRNKSKVQWCGLGGCTTEPP